MSETEIELLRRHAENLASWVELLTIHQDCPAALEAIRAYRQELVEFDNPLDQRLAEIERYANELLALVRDKASEQQLARKILDIAHGQ